VRRKAAPAPGFPPELESFDPAAWVDEYHWRVARWDYWHEHPEVQSFIDPIELLRQRREARLRAAEDAL
jgi:hypothetical protein